MADDIVIRAEGLGKKYVIGHEGKRERYVALRDVVARGGRNLWRKTADMVRGRAVIAGDTTEDFWALKDVSFEVKRGEVLGIIGRNGAGKSTLLKVLSRITEPSEGRVTIKGRVSSLLEVGTGFHPELTGRENIYLNGAILGMTRAEIRRKFDEIVAFAEVEKFLDTPVKRYSSGMYVRLAFAVAAHLEPEILVVDEVLAVGDAEFQKKCLGKLSAVAGQGRTVLFVSHNMNAVERLCKQVMWLERGDLVGIYGDVREGILTYLKGSSKDDLASVWRGSDSLPNNDHFVPQELRISSANLKAPEDAPLSNQFDIVVDIAGQILISDPALNIGIGLYDEEGTLLFWSFTTDAAEANWFKLEQGAVHLRVVIPHRLLNEGAYHVELLASLHHRRWLLEPGRNAPMVSFSIQGGLSDSPYWDHKRPGIFGPLLCWERRQDAALP
jgi:lipopolysaccharide transport system ATP-binding protein